MTITYQVKDAVYVNLTNRCPCNCTFCLRQNGAGVFGSGPLWLEREPTLEETIDKLPFFVKPSGSKPLHCCLAHDREVIRCRIMALLGFDAQDEEDDSRFPHEYLELVSVISVETAISTDPDISRSRLIHTVNLITSQAVIL